jgi:predicted polyphosphate/ATP-dependent NAD kinase
MLRDCSLAASPLASIQVKIGLIVNPIAGMGGPVALKGTDQGGALARSLGAEPEAPGRARRALRRLLGRDVNLLAAEGPMGREVAAAVGLDVAGIGIPVSQQTTAADTRRVAAALREQGVGLILFAGGDGTARDILDAVGESVPILGIPAGVKMQSAVFAITPEAAGDLVSLVAADREGRIALHATEIMDIDEGALREGRLVARLYGYARVPQERRLLQGLKAGTPPEDGTLDALAREIAAEMAPDLLYILGPGTTTQRILGHLGITGTLLGVDAVRNRQLVGRDLTRAQLATLVEGHRALIVLGVIGGQGYTFGRGNQQIGPDIIRLVGRDNILLLASQQKILALGEPRLLADTGDPAVDSLLCGYVRVLLAPGRSTMMRIEA